MDEELYYDNQIPQIPAWKVLNLLPCTPELEKSDPEKATQLYLEALSVNAGSYKVWHAYLQHRVRQLESKRLDDPLYEEVNQCFDKALVFMHKMPRIWIEYCTFMNKQLFVTRTRRVFDKALEALPITQHSRIWPLYLEFVKNKHVPVETAVRVIKRYMQFRPDDAEFFIDYLHSKDRIDEAAKLLSDVINNPHFQSVKSKTKFELWEDLCDMLCEFADQIESVNVEAILRDGINRYPDQEGRLWTSLARYHINLGMFGGARNIFEEAIQKVTTKKAFVEVWEAFTNFEEKYLERLLDSDDITETQMIDLEIRQAALSDLITNNGLLLSQVALRQNPNNVYEWKKRVELCEQLENCDEAKGETYAEAIQIVDPKQALGNYEDIWIDYAMFHAKSNNIQKSKKILEQAVKAQFVRPEDLGKVWCSYIELELRLNTNSALKLARRATSTTKNIRAWSLYINLEKEFGNFNSTKAAYEKIIDLKIVTPQLILDYARFMEENHYYEDSFRCFERGIALFSWPSCYHLWTTYIERFLSRYGNKKLERVRDLFEKCLKDCPKKYAFEFYVLYGKIEEDKGLLGRVQNIYKRGLENVESDDRPSLLKIYLKSMHDIASTHHGLIEAEVES